MLLSSLSGDEQRGAMEELNYLVDIEKLDIEDIAKDFFAEKGLL